MLLSMKKLEERLPSYFMRIHRSYIVNMKKVSEVSKSRVAIDADTVLPWATSQGCAYAVSQRPFAGA